MSRCRLFPGKIFRRRVNLYHSTRDTLLITSLSNESVPLYWILVQYQQQCVPISQSVGTLLKPCSFMSAQDGPRPRANDSRTRIFERSSENARGINEKKFLEKFHYCEKAQKNYPLLQLSNMPFVVFNQLGPRSFFGLGRKRWELILLRQEFQSDRAYIPPHDAAVFIICP